MASVLTNYLGNLVLKRYLVDTPCWLALFTADPTVLSSLVNEVAGGDYIRQRYYGTAPGSKTSGNTLQLVFDNMPACTVTHLALASAQFAGSLLVISPRLAPVIVVGASTRLVVPPGDFAVTV